MKQVIRHGVFETNSSSTHTICINKDFKWPLKENSIEFGTGEFGWEFENYYDIWSKAEYLHEAILSKANDKAEYENLKAEFTKLLNDIGIEKVNWAEIKWEDDDTYPDWNSHGYIDHGNNLWELIQLMLKDPNLFYGFLFNNESCICTGNDNDEEDVNVPRGNYDYIYEKGN